MKEITITCRWESTHTVEVPDDFTVTGNLGDFPADALEEMTPHNASLVDWE